MAMMRYASALIVEPSISSEHWHKTTSNCQTKIARTIIAKYSPEKYLLSHATIIAAVDTEDAQESKSIYKDYLIKPEYSKFVNNNGDAWTKELLANTYRTFIGADNFCEHVQIPELSKGKVIDAVLREIPIGKDKNGKDLTTYYVDILVATDRKHKDLVAKIENKQLQTLSMGCKISFSICSKCGNKAVDETQACEHVRYEKNSYFYDQFGVQRKVAELCGHASEPDSVIFIDASWVANPAFTGAVVRNIIVPPEDVMAKLEKARERKSYEYKEGDVLKAAHESAQKFVKEGTLKTGAAEPSENNPSEPLEEVPVAEGTPELPEEPTQSDIQKWKNQIKQKLLKQLADEINQELYGKPEEERPRELETLDENLIHPTASASLKQMWRMKHSWDRYLKRFAGHLSRKNYDKLRFGTYMILTSNDMTCLKNYGYNRRDLLAVLSSIDSCFKKPLAIEVKKAIAELGGTKGLSKNEAFYAIQKLAGRELNANEIKKAFVWLKIMDFYPE